MRETTTARRIARTRLTGETMGETPARKPTKREGKQRALLRAAFKAFNQQGIHQTSLDHIGERLGLTKAALYYYFPSKSALVAACFSRAMDLTRDCLAEAKREGRTGREKIVIFFRRYIEATHEEMDGYFVLTEDYALDPEDRRRLIEERDSVEKQLRQFVTLGARDGSIVDCDPKLAVFLLLGAVNWIPKWFSVEGDWSYRQLAVAASEMLERMISTAPTRGLAPRVKKIDVNGTSKGTALRSS